MRTLTKLGMGAAALAIGVAVTQAVPGVREQYSSSSALAYPKKVKPTAGRAKVQLQLCFVPASRVELSVGWTLGPRSDVDAVGPPLSCQTPWYRSATLDPGARVVLGWTLRSGVLSKVKYRIIVNNRERIAGEDGANTRLYACVIGNPPCEIP